MQIKQLPQILPSGDVAVHKGRTYVGGPRIANNFILIGADPCPTKGSHTTICIHVGKKL